MTELNSVVHIITRLDMGGSAQNTLKTCAGLAGRKYSVILVYGESLESNMTEAERCRVQEELVNAEKQGVATCVLPTLIRRIDPFMDMAALVGLLVLIRKEKPDIVHTHTSKAGILGRLAAWLTRIPVIVHTPHGHVFHGHFSNLLSKIFLVVERVFDKITDITIALTDGERNDYIIQSVSKPDKLVKIHSGVDVNRFINPTIDENVKRESLGIASDDLVVGTVGWLLPIKGPAFLLKAMQRVWKKYQETKLLFVGKGDLETELKAMVRKAGFRERVLFLGWRDDIHEILQIFDIFVLPSLNEGMGRVIVEAMAAGKPVVASNTGGIPDLVVEGETGLLVDPGDSDGLVEAISTLLENPDHRWAMGQEGRKRCHQFSEELMVEKIDRLYQKLLN